MKDDVKKFLESNLLEDYLLGETSAADSKTVESFIESSAEVKELYLELQDSIEQLAKKAAIKPPADLRDKVIQSQAVRSTPTIRRRLSTWSVAASVAALLFAFATFNFWNQNRQLKSQISDLNVEMNEVKETLASNSNELQGLENTLSVINDPNTEKVVLKGNSLAPQLSTVAFWNKEEDHALLKVYSLPKLENKQCYQMWADVEGEMINVGVLPENEFAMIELPFIMDAESLNITIEPEGGSDHPNVAMLVASSAI